jgi:cell division protease FtsH
MDIRAHTSIRIEERTLAMEQRQQLFSLWYFVLTFVLLMLLQTFLAAPHVQPLDYSEFKALLRADNIARVTLGTSSLQGTLHTEGIAQILPKEKVDMIVKTTGKEDTSGLHPFTTVRVDDPTLVQELEAAKVPYTGKIETTWVATLLSWVVPAVLVIGLWGFVLRRLGPQQGLMSIGKSKAKVYMEKSTGGHLSGCRRH